MFDAEEVKKVLKKMFDRIGEPDRSTWVQAGKLRPDDIARMKKMRSDAARSQRKAKVLLAQLEALKAQNELASAQWWNHIEEEYSLPPGGCFEITDDCRILMEPRK